MVEFRQKPGEENITQYKTKEGVYITSVKMWFGNVFSHDLTLNMVLLMAGWTFTFNTETQTEIVVCSAC